MKHDELLMMSEDEYFFVRGNERSQGFMRIVDADLAQDGNWLVWQEQRAEDKTATPAKR